MCPNVLKQAWFRHLESNNNQTQNNSQSTPFELDFTSYQKQVVDSIPTKKRHGKRAKIKKKLCSLFSRESSPNQSGTNLNQLMEILALHPQVSTCIDKLQAFLDSEIFDFDRSSVEFEDLECKTDVWSEKYDSCIEINASTKYLLCMNCNLYDIRKQNVNFEFSNMIFKIDYCKQPDTVDFQVEMKGKFYYENDLEFGISAKSIWNNKKFVIFINQTKVYNLSSENPLKDFNTVMSEHYGKFGTNSSLDLSKIEKYFTRKEKQDYFVKFNNYLQLEDNCLYHGTSLLDFRPSCFPIELHHSTVQLQHIQFNYFTVKKKKPFVTAEIDNISYIDACKMIYNDECENNKNDISLAEFISGYNCLANNLRGYLIYTKGRSATLSYKSIGGDCFGWCPPGLFTIKKNKQGTYSSVFKPSKDENGKRNLPVIYGFGDFKFHKNQINTKDTPHQLETLLEKYFITNERKTPILNFEFMKRNGLFEYLVFPSSHKQAQNGLFIGKLKFTSASSNDRKVDLTCDFMINGSMNIATIDFLEYGKIWMRPIRCASFLNRLYLMSINESLSDIEIACQ